MTSLGTDLRSPRFRFVADTVDLFQKTLFPSFSLAGSHRSLPPSNSPVPARQLRTCATDVYHTSRRKCAHTQKCVPMRRVHVPGETLKCAPESTGAHARSSRERRGAALPDATRFLTRSPSPSVSLSLSVPSISPPPLLLFPFPLHALRTHPAWHVRARVCVCRESNDGNETLSSTISRKVIHDEFPKVEEACYAAPNCCLYIRSRRR